MTYVVKIRPLRGGGAAGEEASLVNKRASRNPRASNGFAQVSEVNARGQRRLDRV